MGKALYDASAGGARRLRRRRTRRSDSRSRGSASRGPRRSCKLTANTQPAILTHSIAAFEDLRARFPKRLEGAAFAAGHSLGEYSAGVAAGALAFSDAVRLVRERGHFMQEAVPSGVGAMAAIVGLAPDVVDGGLPRGRAATGEIVSPANFNSPEQTVIAGHAAAVARASELCRAAGRAQARDSASVSAPFHCALMPPARERLRAPARRARVRRRALAGRHQRRRRARGEFGGAPARRLGHQVASPVRWVESIEKIGAMGAASALELGPGAVLAGLVKRIRKEISVVSVGKAEDLGKLG